MVANELALIFGGTCGGRPDMAQASGTEPANLSNIFPALEKLLVK